MNLPFFFQNPEFVYRDKSNSILSFEEDDCFIFFSEENKKITSLARSPFGSFTLHNNGRIKTIHSLAGKVLSHCKINGIQSIEIKCLPGDLFHRKIRNDQRSINGSRFYN